MPFCRCSAAVSPQRVCIRERRKTARVVVTRMRVEHGAVCPWCLKCDGVQYSCNMEGSHATGILSADGMSGGARPQLGMSLRGHPIS
jgi:hypothetical protein